MPNDKQRIRLGEKITRRRKRQTVDDAVRAFDETLRLWFAAPNAQALSELTNSPRIAGWRASRRAKVAREAEANERHAPEALEAAAEKRLRRRAGILERMDRLAASILTRRTAMPGSRRRCPDRSDKQGEDQTGRGLEATA